MRKIIFIYGPTASGKSQLGIDLAERYSGEIINCDSVAVYRHLDIGTAKPSAGELLRVPHHLISCIDYPQEFSAAQFKEQAGDLINVIGAKDKPVFVVGGTGFYFRALEYGMPEEIQCAESLKQAIKKEYDAKGISALWNELERSDPVYAQSLHQNDHYRIMRGLELTRSGYLASEQFKKRERELEGDILKIYLKPSREELLEKMIGRTKKMISEGLIEEVESLQKRGFSDWAPMRSVGYKETLEFINSEKKDIVALKKAITTHSMQLAKRQKTWFNKEQGQVKVLDSYQNTKSFDSDLLAKFLDA